MSGAQPRLRQPYREFGPEGFGEFRIVEQLSIAKRPDIPETGGAGLVAEPHQLGRLRETQSGNEQPCQKETHRKIR